MKIKEWQKIYNITDWSCPRHGVTFTNKKEFKQHINEHVEVDKERSAQIEIAKKHLKSRTLTECEARLLFNTCELGGIDRETHDYVSKLISAPEDRYWKLVRQEREGEIKRFYFDGSGRVIIEK